VKKILKIIKNQYKCKDRDAYIDILCEDKINGDYVIIELKSFIADKDTYNQINNYLDCINNTIAKGKDVKGLVISKWFDDEFVKLCNTNENISYLKLRNLGLG
jgi:RecB family endonuclease NucS